VAELLLHVQRLRVRKEEAEEVVMDLEDPELSGYESG
jgi:hypothetical protein